MRRVLASGLVVGGVVLAFCLLRALTLPSRQLQVAAVELPAVNAPEAAARLGASIRFETISYEEPGRLASEQFDALFAYLAQQFPLTHERLSREWVNRHTAVYHWQGSDAGLEPAILMAHTDVVPVVPGTEGRWQQPPFSGAIADGFVWGRGAMDDKVNVLAILEAVERSLQAGHRPQRSVYLVFGHDEELGGSDGAERVAELFAARGIRAAIVLDEGGAIVQGGLIPGVSRPVATIGVAEKGSLSLMLRVEAEGGHSSTPPPHTAIGTLSRALARVEDHPMPGGVRGAAGALIDFVAPEASLGYRLLFANLWLFGALLESELSSNTAGNATLRTTTAITVIRGGVKSNVLPTDAEAIVNFRTLPGDTAEVVTEHVRAAIADPEVSIAVSDKAREASPVSPTDGDAFRLLQTTIGEVFPEAIVAPFLTLGGTDSRHFTRVCDHVFRFSPVLATREDLARPHGFNERIGVENYGRIIQFYQRLLAHL